MYTQAGKDIYAEQATGETVHQVLCFCASQTRQTRFINIRDYTYSSRHQACNLDIPHALELQNKSFNCMVQF